MRDHNEDIQGYRCPVDDSGAILEQGGTRPSPPGILTVPPEPEETGAGVGAVPPCPTVKVGEEQPPGYLDHTENLDESLLVLPLYPPSTCNLKYLVFGCNCKRKIVPSTCMTLDCENCAPFLRARRGRSILRRLLQPTPYQRRRYTQKPVIYTIFTVPMELREAFLDRQEWQKVRKKAWNILKEHFGALYGVEGSHPKGDREPNLFHPHLNFLWTQRPGFQPFINVDKLREEWSKVLWVPVVDVYTHYSTSIPQIAKWASYVGKTFPGCHKWSGPLRWYGKYPKGLKPVHDVCPDCGARFQLIGWIEAEIVEQWLHAKDCPGRDPPWYNDYLITKVKTASECSLAHA